jgi:soluble lytic murein transglycosylase
MVQQRPLLASIFILLLSTAGPAPAARIEEQRATFVKAEAALKRGSMVEFDRLRSSIRDYPLYPYLEYQALLQRLDRASNKDVQRFLSRYGATPLASRLRANWLDQIAGQKRWSDYLSFYRPTGNISRRCHHLHALIATGRPSEAFPEVEEIWLYGKSRPRSCDPVFDAWSKAGYLTTEINWRRIEKAMEAGEWRLAEYLGRSLSDTDRVWLKRWVRLYRTPARADQVDRFSSPHPYREAMLSHAVRRLARWDGPEALALWQTIKPRYPFSQAQILRTQRYLVRNLSRTPGDAAYDFIRSTEVGDDLPAQEARIRAGLMRQDWPRVLRWIAALPEVERDQNRWMYWLARALEGTGDPTADAIYRQVATDRGYYGFMAADRAGVPYHLEHTETPAPARCLARIERLDAVRRAQELFALERWTDARREWRTATRDMSPGQLQAAAKLAEKYGWHDRAIFTLARTGYWDDLELRFPLEHAELVAENAKLHGIDIAWVFAVMRQESAFMSNARSHAGAMGLMQLMPATARQVAKNVLKTRPPRRQDLFEPDTNIALGSAYLKQMKQKLGDSAVLATAAYNAGPHRVTRWLPEETLPADIWIELVPFKETRGYLRRVLAYTVIYEKRMGMEPTRLEQRLHPVPPSVSMIGQLRPGGPASSAG